MGASVASDATRSQRRIRTIESERKRERERDEGVNYCQKISRSLPIVVDSIVAIVIGPVCLVAFAFGSRGIFRRLIACRIFLADASGTIGIGSLEIC